MNNHKFTFIICTNDKLLLNECIHYIDHLIVPEGYEYDLLTVMDADSMTGGYQEAMLASDAKYKIYMHQDVFVLNKYLLLDLLSVFGSDPTIGMVGMVGYEKVSADGIMWHEKRLGNLYVKEPEAPYPRLDFYRFDLSSDGYYPVALADGFFLATSHDLPWNTTQLDGWDFYDAFQCIRFLSEGYKVVIPRQRHPWCMHDDNVILNMLQYDFYRQIFKRTYPQFLGKSYEEILNSEI